MMPIDLPVLASTCAPAVHPVTIAAVVRNESAANPFAIGVVGGRLARQPRTRAEAEATAAALERAGWNYSVGLAQVNRANFARYGLAGGGAFDPCANLRAGSEILADCYRRASIETGPGQRALRYALSCYYSGNSRRGFKVEADGTSYVQRVVAQARPPAQQGAVERLPAAPAATGVPATADASATTVPAIAVVPDASPVRRVKRVSKGEGPANTPAKRSGWDVFGDFGATKENQE
ncbi:lytic transglycosylase domain-containing protein [Burkholderia orbicola]|uniref:lytic transglycosylase domain-containing protein n=1 Tax=Burkholderia cepacia complex TaxID=87882 RepID=UPI001902F28D|nr:MULTISPECIES: lytic transglycosylase domain-containing protein [Burkholderia cepacia complex]MBJ9594095.1 lytic transglycosylase domain-containing protein [Burkholderia seminalis]MDN7472549.1 lytic transglycosylase domain-containing protein [Burkholderia orbicola]MDN7507511.1 lytic transglycosylase domain-containing protein [Burkholderia orbicola]